MYLDPSTTLQLFDVDHRTRVRRAELRSTLADSIGIRPSRRLRRHANWRLSGIQ